MQLPTIATLLLLPVLATAQSYSSLTTTLTSTQTQTRTITVSQVVASVTSTYPAHNSTTAGPTAYPTASPTTTSLVSGTESTVAPSSTVPSDFMGAASSLNSMYAGSAGLVIMIAAALL